MAPLIAAAQWGGEFDGVFDDVNALFEFPPLFTIPLGGFELGINRTILISWLMTAVAITLFVVALRRPAIVPGKLQSVAEGAVGLVRGIAHDIIGHKGERFVPLLTAFFVFVLFMNVAKITPFLMLPPTGRIAWPFFLAIITWVVYIVVGIKEQGFVGYFKGIAFPPGVPKPVYLLLTPIELVSAIVLRPFTLMVRLFANMVAGHILVVITLVTAWVFLPSMPIGWTLGVFAIALGPLVFGFELMIIFLQAYIFTMLAAVYIGSSVEAAH